MNHYLQVPGTGVAWRFLPNPHSASVYKKCIVKTANSYQYLVKTKHIDD